LALLFGAVERLDDAEVERILATARAPPPPPPPRARSRPAAAAAPRAQAPPVPRLRASSSDEERELAEFFGVPRPPPADAPAASPAEPRARPAEPRARPAEARPRPAEPRARPAPSPSKPRAASGQSSMNLQQLLQDIVQQLGREDRIRFREFVQELKAKRDAGEITSLSEALLMGGEKVVGNDVLRRACAKQDARARSSSEEARREAEEGRARPPEPRARPAEPRPRPAEPRARPAEPPAAPRAPKRRRFEAVPANAVVIDIGGSDDDAPPPPNRPHVIDLT
jgi:hypothetical protein